MNKFEKVSFEQYCAAVGRDADLTAEYNDIKLPVRATTGSAGYDIFLPCDIDLEPGESIKIPTGIRCFLDTDKVLMIFPRSGLGTKNRFVPRNLVAQIDSDYVNAANEGHIMMFMVNDGDKPLHLEKGKAFVQGIIVPYFTTVDDAAEGERVGGFGSTGH